MKKGLLFLALTFAAVACQQKPTRVTSQESVKTQEMTTESLLQGHPVILDVRSPFEFNLTHVPGAINVRWEDFSEPNPRARGRLQSDLFALARRLALIGVDPDTKVLVLGLGAKGAGEEGRVAWTLKVLGVREVYTLVHTSYRSANPLREVPMTQNKPYWKPSVIESLMLDLKDFKTLIASPDVVVVDVRSSQEYALRNISQAAGVHAQVLQIEWREFFDERGLPTKSIEKTLAEKGVTKDSPIVFLSNHGVRSGAATYALSFLGYKRVTNFAGGYEQWK